MQSQLATLEPLKAVYVAAWVAGVHDEDSKFYWREEIMDLIDETELNAVVIDVKDYTGRVSFPVIDESLKKIGSESERIPDIRSFIKELHDQGIYVIGRLSVFQDSYLVGKRPDLAVRRAGDGLPAQAGEIWRDRKGIAWLDPAARGVWGYTVALSRESYAHGFDEINFDYIRFPSDGDTRDIKYTFFNEASSTQALQMRNFYQYLHDELKPYGIPISADLFGMTTTNPDDLNIGQVLENALPYFDYISPMVYPSHYPAGFNGWPNPNEVPYEIVKFSLDKAVARIMVASTTPHSSFGNVTIRQLRPWLQDFDYGGIYDEAKVRAQKQAVYDAGLTSWMLWDPSVKYTREALDK